MTFAVLYRFYLKPDLEADFIHYWKIVASYFATERGALGSTLHKSKEGLWVAYSKWPDKATRDASWPQENELVNPSFPSSIKAAIENMKACFDSDRQLPEICLEVVEEVCSPALAYSPSVS